MSAQGKSKYLASFSIRDEREGNKPLNKIFFNFIAFCLVIGFLILMVWGIGESTESLEIINVEPISLNPKNLIEYSFQTLFRMLIAAFLSLIFAVGYATLAAKNKYLGELLIPLLDILQSVPVLGYISFTVGGFLAFFPGNILGAELVALFAIFTSQVWNLIFSFYQSLKTIPKELIEASKVLKLSGWQQFWKVELPFGIPGLAWNMTVSISSGWFFIVVSEAIVVGNHTINLQGIGSYIALAIEQRDLKAVSYAILAIILAIVLFDQLIIKPIIVWADKFHYEMSRTNSKPPYSWIYYVFCRSYFFCNLMNYLSPVSNYLLNLPFSKYKADNIQVKYTDNLDKDNYFNYLWYGGILIVFVICGYYLFNFIHQKIGWEEVIFVIYLSLLTSLRVFVLTLITSLIWVPVGVYIGLKPQLSNYVQPIVQFLAAFPANLLFPVTVILITKYNLNPNIWLSPLMIMGAQWYILFNVIAGASSITSGSKETIQIFKIKGLTWWKKVIIPSIIPYYLTGVVTASGGAWNASVIAEIVNFGDVTLIASGLGSYIAHKTQEGNFEGIVLGIGVMCLFVVIINKILWQPLHKYTSKKFQI